MTGYNACLLSIYAARNWARHVKNTHPDLSGAMLVYWCERSLPGLFEWGPGDGRKPAL
jgi:hypothetical protein